MPGTYWCKYYGYEFAKTIHRCRKYPITISFQKQSNSDSSPYFEDLTKNSLPVIIEISFSFTSGLWRYQSYLSKFFWKVAMHTHTGVYYHWKSHATYTETNLLPAPLKVAAAFKGIYSGEFEWRKFWLLPGDFLNISHSFQVSNDYDPAFPWLFIPQQLRCCSFSHFPRKCYASSSWSSPSWTVTFSYVSISDQLLLGSDELIWLSCCC